MVTHELLVKAAGAVLTGLVGVSAYETVRKALGTAPIRRASVTVMEWGLRGTRRAEAAAESARLTVADVVAELAGASVRRRPCPLAPGSTSDDCS